MKTTLSTIILEESIKASLFEFDIPNDDTKTNTTKPKPKPVPKNKVSAAKIADAIINSKSWFNDREASLYNAIISIPDSKTFWEVNKIIQTREGKTFSGYLATILNDDEWEWWNPIIKYLTTIIPKTQWKTVIKNVLDKTTGIAGLAKQNRTLAAEITKELPQVGLSDSDGGSSFDLWDLAAYGVLTYFLCKKSGFKCWDRFKKLVFPNKQPSGIEVANKMERIIRAPLRQNKRALIKIMDYELKKGRLTHQEYNEMKSYLKGDNFSSSIPTQDINRAFFNAVIKSWQEWSTTKPIIPGEAKKIIEKVDDPTFTKIFGPKLQAIEDRLLGKQKEKINKNNNNIIRRKINTSNLDVSKVKINWKKFNMSQWLTIMTRSGYIQPNLHTNIFLEKVSKDFSKQISRGIDADIAARQALLRIGNEYDLNDFSEISGEFGSTPNTWLRWVSENDKTISKYNFYDKFTTFPTYDQWKQDMMDAGVKIIDKNRYYTSYYLWANKISNF